MITYNKSRVILVVLVVIIVGVAILGLCDIRAVRAFPSFTAVIPNGRRVPCPRGVAGCSNAGLCEGACVHECVYVYENHARV